MIKYILLLVASVSWAARPEQILMEEPTRTNRSAAAWLMENTNITSAVALRDSIPATAYRLAYSNGLSIIPGVLEVSTERFSTNWSYRFSGGGGIGADTVYVRNDFTSEADPLVVSNINTRFLSVTNRGTYTYFESETSSITAPRTNGNNATEISGATTLYNLRSPVVTSPSDALNISAGAVLFKNEPVLQGSGGMYSSTNYPPMSVFHSAGMFNVGKYVDGVMWLTRTNTGFYTASILNSVGMGNVYPNVTYAVEGERVPADWAHIPVLMTLHNSDDPHYELGWWEYDQNDMAAAFVDMTNAVLDIFAATGSVTGVAGFTTATSLIGASPSAVISRGVQQWVSTNSFSIDVRTAVSNYISTSAIQINAPREEGVVSVADGYNSNYVNFHRYRHMTVDTTSLMRVSVSLNFTNSAALTSTEARYWLAIGGDRVLSRRVSSAGDYGPAFTITSPSSPVEGYLYLDFSEVVQVHSNALMSAWYYVKFEELKGFVCPN